LLYVLGLALGGQGRLDEARGFYEAYLKVRPADPTARSALGAVIAGRTMRDLYKLQPEELERRAAQILDLDAGNPKGQVVRAVALRHQRDMQGALVLLESAVERLPGDADVARLLAETQRDRGYQLLLVEGRRDLAFDHFRRFLDEPRDLPTEAVANLVLEEWRRRLEEGQQALVAGDVDLAARAFERCLELRPEEEALRLQLGLALLQRGGDRLDQALAQFSAAAAWQRARGGDASLPVFYEVVTLSRLDRRDDARRTADAFLDAPGTTAAADVVERIRVARDAVAERR
jgi:tetratricopeptide (TPR) repeat protein